jgi:hypothetical protein
MGPGAHGTGSARTLEVVSKAHALELGCFSTRNNFTDKYYVVFVSTYFDRIILLCELKLLNFEFCEIAVL